MAIIGNNDVTDRSGQTTSLPPEHRLNDVDTLVCPANQILTEFHIKSYETSGTVGQTMGLAVYDITGGADNAPLVTSTSVTIDATTPAVYSVTGLSVDLSAYSGQTLAICIGRESQYNNELAWQDTTGHPRSSTTSVPFDANFAQQDTGAGIYYGVWAVAETAAPTSETATTGNIPLVIQAGYTLVDLVDPVTTNASLLFGVTGDTPVTGDHLEYDITSVLDSGVSLSVAASGVWTVTEAVDGDWTTDITVSRRVVQADGTIGTEAVLTLEAPTGTVTSLATSENEKLIEHFRSVTGLSTYSLNELAIAYYKQVGSTGSPQFNEALKAAQDGVPFKGLGPTDWRN